MRHAHFFFMAVLSLVACSKPEESSVEGAAAATGEIPAGIYDGERAVLQVTDLPNDKRLFSFAHTFESKSVQKQIIKGAVEVKKGEVPKLTADEIYPCSASVGFEDGKVVATGRCRGTDEDFKVLLEPRDHGKLKGTFVKDGMTIKVASSGSKGVQFSVEGAGLSVTQPTSGEWIHGGGAFRGHFGNCAVSIIARSPEKELIFDVGSTAKSIDIDARGLDCGALKEMTTARFTER